MFWMNLNRPDLEQALAVFKCVPLAGWKIGADNALPALEEQYGEGTSRMKVVNLNIRLKAHWVSDGSKINFDQSRNPAFRLEMPFHEQIVQNIAHTQGEMS